MSPAVPAQRPRGTHDPVPAAATARRVGQQEHHRRPHVQRTPAPHAVTTVIARATPPAHPAAISLSPARPHDDHQLAAAADANVLNDGLPQTQQPSPYPDAAHVATALCRIPAVKKPEP